MLISFGHILFRTFFGEAKPKCTDIDFEIYSLWNFVTVNSVGHPNISSKHYILNITFASFINLMSKKKYCAEFLLVSNTGGSFTRQVIFLAS